MARLCGGLGWKPQPHSRVGVSSLAIDRSLHTSCGEEERLSWSNESPGLRGLGPWAVSGGSGPAQEELLQPQRLLPTLVHGLATVAALLEQLV